MPRIKQVLDYPADGPLASGRALTRSSRRREEQARSTQQVDQQGQEDVSAGTRRSGRLAARTLPEQADSDEANSNEADVNEGVAEEEEERDDESDTESELSDVPESEAGETHLDEAESGEDDVNDGDNIDEGQADELEVEEVDESEDDEAESETNTAAQNAQAPVKSPRPEMPTTQVTSTPSPLPTIQPATIVQFVSATPSALGTQAEPLGRTGPSNVPNPTPTIADTGRTPSRARRSRGNGNTKGYHGRFLKNKWYSYPDAVLMNGTPWTEEADILHWHLRTMGLSQKACSKYLYPFDEGACQNRWQRMKGFYAGLQGEELVAALAERDRIGGLFAQGQFEYRIALSEEVERAKAAAKANKHLVKVRKPAQSKGTSKAKGEAKEEAAKKDDETEDQEDKRYQRVEAWEEGDDEGENEY